MKFLVGYVSKPSLIDVFNERYRYLDAGGNFNSSNFTHGNKVILHSTLKDLSPMKISPSVLDNREGVQGAEQSDILSIIKKNREKNILSR